MVRAYEARPIEADVVERVLAAALRAPSAGNTQGWRLVVLEGAAQTGRYWDITLPQQDRANFAFPHLLDAPVLVLPLADPDAYTDRYSEPDKAATGLSDQDAWPVPYWTVDTSFAVMLLLLAAQNEGLGALFFGVFEDEAGVRRELGIPDGLQLLGAITLGYPIPGERPAGSASRPKPPRDTVIHRGGW
jgi:nitroreductase